MRRYFTTVIFASLLMSSSAWSEMHTVSVHSIKDGDTIVVDVGGKQEQLQLLGIDAPEDVPNPKLQKDIERTKLGMEQLISIGKLATAHLSTLTAPGETLEVDANLAKRDRYGRIPAVVRNIAGHNINAAMVQDGYAVVMGRYPFDAALKADLLQLQQKAITERLGLWGSHQESTKAWSGK